MLLGPFFISGVDTCYEQAQHCEGASPLSAFWFCFILYVFIHLETGSHSAVQTGLKLPILLPPWVPK